MLHTFSIILITNNRERKGNKQNTGCDDMEEQLCYFSCFFFSTFRANHNHYCGDSNCYWLNVTFRLSLLYYRPKIITLFKVDIRYNRLFFLHCHGEANGCFKYLQIFTILKSWSNVCRQWLYLTIAITVKHNSGNPFVGTK